MRLTTLKLKNFRGYRGETVVGFDDLTAFVGKMMLASPQSLKHWIFFSMTRTVLQRSRRVI